MGGLLRSAPWRAKPKTAAHMAGQTGARTVDAAPDGALPRGDPPPASEDVRGLCIADSVCGVFAEIKPPAPPS